MNHAKFWDKIYKARGVTNKATISGTWDDKSVAWHYDFIEKGIGEPSGVEHALDSGSGAGHWIWYWQKLGAKVTAIEISETACNAISERYPRASVLCLDAKSFSTNRKHDAISAIGFMHHIVKSSDFKTLLKSMASWLKPDGRIYISTQFENRSFGWPAYKVFRSTDVWMEACQDAGLRLVEIVRTGEPKGIRKHDDLLVLSGEL